MKKNIRILCSLVLTMAMIITSHNVVSISKAATKIKLNKTKVTMTVGSTVKLKLKNAKKKVKWSTSNKKVVKVNKKGKITAVKLGSAKIVAKSAGKKYTCKVTVTTANNLITSEVPVTFAPSVTSSASASGTPSAGTTKSPSQTTSAQTSSPSQTTSAQTSNPSQTTSVQTSNPSQTTSAQTSSPSQTNSGSATSDTPEGNITLTNSSGKTVSFNELDLYGISRPNGSSLSSTNFGFTSSDYVTINSTKDSADKIYYCIVGYNTLSDLTEDELESGDYVGVKKNMTKDTLNSLGINDSAYYGFKAYTGPFSVVAPTSGDYWVIYAKIVDDVSGLVTYISSDTLAIVVEGTTPTPYVETTATPYYKPYATNIPSDEGSSSTAMPTNVPADTLAIGSDTVTLGETVTELKNECGTPVRIDSSPQGLYVYIYNPSGDYKNYYQVLVNGVNDSSIVVGMRTMSAYFSYEGEIKSNGTKCTSSNDSENIIVSTDYGSSNVYAIEVVSNNYSISQFQSPYNKNNTYTDDICSDQSYEIFELANAYRVYKGLTPYSYFYNNSAYALEALARANIMAGKNTTEIDSIVNDEYYIGLGGTWGEIYSAGYADSFDSVRYYVKDFNSKLVRAFSGGYASGGFAYTSSGSYRTYSLLDYYGCY